MKTVGNRERNVRKVVASLIDVSVECLSFESQGKPIAKRVHQLIPNSFFRLVLSPIRRTATYSFHSPFTLRRAYVLRRDDCFQRDLCLAAALKQCGSYGKAWKTAQGPKASPVRSRGFVVVERVS
jgi:hypothetical protein